ncbi:hypothetical protein F4778DRAFT_764561 [Xylariomycetidae sp. FL2044]|nr:hypothetical protein F4778DRAFT_764561 [Xylariomycetidae sp. FL2044]
MDFSFQGLVQQHTQQMDFLVQKAVDALLQYSRLAILLIRIGNVTEDSFHVSIEARVTRTGAVSAKIAPMDVDLCGPRGRFGKVRLPEIKVDGRQGAEIVITNQLVEIMDVAALRAFVEAVITSDAATLSLRNGHTVVQVKAPGVMPRSICYEKDVPITGMAGPHVSVVSASMVTTPTTTTAMTTEPPQPPSISVKIHVRNPSPMEICFGMCSFEIQNGEGQVFAELKGILHIRINHFESTLQGRVDTSVVMGRGPARLVGKRCAGAGWCDETIKGIDVPLSDTKKIHKALGLEFDNDSRDFMDEKKDEEEDEKRPAKSFMLRSKFWRM